MKKFLMTALVMGLVASPSFAEEAVSADSQAQEASTQLVPVYQMGENNQLKTQPVFYVLHGDYAPGEALIVQSSPAPAGQAATVEPTTTAPTSAADEAATSETTTQAETKASSGVTSTVGKILDPKAIVNSAVQGAVQSGVNRVLDN